MAGWYNKLVQYGREYPIKAGHREVLPHLTTIWTRIITSTRRSTKTSAGPERSQLLRILPSLTLRQFFSFSAYVFLRQHWRTPMFRGRQCSADAYVRWTPSFSCANVLLMPIIWWRLSFAGANFFVYITGAYIFVYFASAYISVWANNLLVQIF
jgi:hypothetical protein